MTDRPQDQRQDIQGLRGVAILAVMGVHAWPETLRGGFVGVDVFFVLSGYLISTILQRDIDAGRFSVVAFYRRRALRLFPALATVLLCCLLFAAAFTFPSEAGQVGKHVAAGAGFVSNIVLWREAGYFDASSESKPLLHLWSLGIEEQFYIFWPLLMVLAARRHRLALIALLALGSFTLNVTWVVEKAKGTFFLLPTRAWELLIGALLAHAMTGPAPAWFARHREALAGAGVLLLGAAFALLDKTRPFPGWWALLPTLGTAALLAAGPAAWVNRRVLARPVLVFYGSISYALYLWHWPLLVFPSLLGVEIDSGVRVAMLAASVALAHLTTEYVERPLRFGAPRPRLPVQLAGTLAVVGLAGGLLFRFDGGAEAYPPGVRAIARAESGFDFGVYRSARCFLDLAQGPDDFAPECGLHAAPSRSRVLLWGDSHAASLYPGLAQQARHQAQATVLSQWTKARCPPLLPAPAHASLRCGETVEHVLGKIAHDPPDTVVLAGHWSFYESPGEDGRVLAQALRRTVDRLQAAGVGRVVVVGHLPAWTQPLPRLLLREWSETRAVPLRSAAHLDGRAPAADQALRIALQGSGARFVAPLEHLCNAAGCLVTQAVGGEVRPLAFDQSHLTAEGSQALVAAAPEAFFK